MARVAGCDPGTSSLDVLVLNDGTVTDQVRFEPEQLRSDPAVAVKWLEARGPLDLVAGPSGYGLPLIRGADCTDEQLELMSLVKPEDRSGGVAAYSATAKAFRDSKLPVVFLPGVIHLPTVPAWRKLNRIDLGTPDKLCVAALAIERVSNAWTLRGPLCIVELGTAFTAAIVVDEHGAVIDGVGGTFGAVGWRSGGSWDGEVAYWRSPLKKVDLFTGGASYIADTELRRAYFIESLVKTVGGLCGLHEPSDRFEKILLSGRLFATEPAFVDSLHLDTLLGQFAGSMYEVNSLESLYGAWVKEAAQGAALIADGLVGGRCSPLVERLKLRDASGTVLDWIQSLR